MTGPRSRRGACAAAALLAFAGSLLAQPSSSDVPVLRLQIIVVDSLEQSQRIRAALQQGADFSALAKRESLSPTADEGGDLGPIDPRSLHADLQPIVAGLEPGGITDPVKLPTGRGYAIFKRAGGEGSASPRTMSNAAALPISGRAVIREPPNTSGLVNVEAAVRAFPKPDGWDRDPRSICAVRREAIATVTGRLRALTDPDNRVLDSLSPREQLHARSVAGLFESYQGHMDRAIARIEEAYGVARASIPEAVPVLEEMLGSLHFHAAAMANGVYRRPDDRCLFPPPARGAVFANGDGSRKAIEYFTRYLGKTPDDLEVRWLLNLAYATLGQYPAGVPKPYRIPAAAFASPESIGRFVDVAADAGLGGVPFVSPALLVDDFDGDGRFDVVVSSYDICDHVYFFRNEGDGTFADRTEPAGLATVAGGQGLSHADYDNDGCLDLLVTRGAWQGPMPLSLLRGDCQGAFRDVTAAAGLADGRYASQLGVWTDIDNDGFVDLFVGNEQGPSQLFRNRGDGTFANVSRRAGVERTTFVKGAVAEDYDHDGFPDLFLSNQVGGDNLLYRNNGDGTFAEVGREAGVNQSWRSFATWFFDYDNDGWADLFVASDYASVEESMRTYLRLPRSSGPLKLYRNTRDGRFADVTTAVGLDRMLMPMGANFGDVDNDGYPDIYLGTGAPEWGSLVPNVLLRNVAGRTFVDITTSSGTGELHKTHGIAFVNLDGSGQKTILAGMGGAALADAHALRVFRNPGNDHRWLDLKLVGVKSNRAALGARIKVTVGDGRGGVRSIHRTVNSGGSFGSSPLEQQIGLGRAGDVADVEITWPHAGTTQRLTAVPVDQAIEVTEQVPGYRRLARARVVLGGREGVHSRTTRPATEGSR